MHSTRWDIGRAACLDCRLVEAGNQDFSTSVGAIGELVTVDPILARGYLRDKEKTEKAFIAPQFATKDRSAAARRVSKTADLVRYSHNGNIIILRRKDPRLKLQIQ